MSNLIFKSQEALLNKTFANGLSSYTQSHCQCTLTADGYRIYRTPNKLYPGDGSIMWGGLVLKPHSSSIMQLVKGHTYVIMFHIKGKSSNAADDIGWSNNVGWGAEVG